MKQPELNIPHFIVAGTARAGTTALYDYLRQHPQIFLPVQKEPCFFCFENHSPNYVNGKFAFAATNIEAYQKLYASAPSGSLCGDMSTPYLYLYEKTIAGIKKYCVDSSSIKIIIILRNPTERAFSQFAWRKRDGREPLSFAQALNDESDRIRNNWSIDYHYAQRGLYSEQVKAFQNNFSNVKIILYDDFLLSPEITIQSICEFLNIQSDFKFDLDKRSNKSFSPKIPWINRLLTYEHPLKFKLLDMLGENNRRRLKEKLFSLNNAEVLKPDEASVQRLKKFYKDDIIALQEITRLDLSKWLN